MSITEFLAKVGFKPYGSVINSWDAFNERGDVLMQLWSAPDQRVRNHPVVGAYLRVRCFDAAHYAEDTQRQAVGHAGRQHAIESIERGATGYAALSSPPGGARGPGVWAKHADLDRVYPILAVERSQNGDVFVLLATAVPSASLAS